MPPMDRRPPLAVSPRRLRPRKNLCPLPSVRTPPAAASIRAKPKTPIRSSLPSDQLLLPQHQLISSELMEMARGAKEDLDNTGTSPIALKSNGTTPLFERGRFYELYSARRNERLRRRQEDHHHGVDETVAQDPGIAVELSKRRNAKKAESLRKSVPAGFSVSRGSGNLRSSLRSVKEMNGKKSFAAVGCEKRTSVDGGRRMGTRSALRI